MARDKALEALVGDTLGSLAGLTEKIMFGGLAWLLHGKLLCAARHDGMLVRLGKGNDGWALQLPGVEPLFSGARRMEGWVRVPPELYASDDQRERLLAGSIAFVRQLPAKRP